MATKDDKAAGSGPSQKAQQETMLDDEFSLELQEASPGRVMPGKESSGKRTPDQRKEKNQSSEVLSYRHDDKRTNNPHVGMVDTHSDGVEGKTAWQYDPHIDPEAAKDIDTIKGITALRVQMNTDLLTEDLKKGRASNESFWLMGQPDVIVKQIKTGYYQVEVRGFDYFDTKTGELKSGGKKNIAMWALDTDYDNRSLFPRQVFFPMAGSGDGWNKLRKDIRAELNEELLEQFHGTVSLPFEAGENECIAVKIVDDRGIESLKVINLDRIAV